MTKRVLLWTIYRAFPVKQKILNIFFQISDQVGTILNSRLVLSGSLVNNSADGSRPDFQKYYNRLFPEVAWLKFLIFHTLRKPPGTTSPNHVPHPVSSHTANELPRIISFVLEECERSETLAGNFCCTGRFSKSLLPSAEFFTRDPDNTRRLFSTYLITDLKKYVKDLQLNGKSSMNCPKKDPFCHYIEDELLIV
eukprot:sb/3470940/